VNAWDEPRPQVRDFAIQQGLNYTILLDGYELARRYNCDGIPTNFLIDRQGRIAARFDDFRRGDEKRLAKLIEEAMASGGTDGMMNAE
jgi:peroxiredoxin